MKDKTPLSPARRGSATDGDRGTGATTLSDASLADGETRALYESISTKELLELKEAFELDRAAATKPEAIAFCDNRLALIAEVLSKRGAGEGE